MKFLIILIIITLTISACATNDGGNNPFVKSNISVCGGGLEEGIAATIEAEYEKQKGNLDAGFKRYVHTVLDANDVSDEKYDKYITCVLTIDERDRENNNKKICIETCDRGRTQCLSDINEEYNSCIRKGQASCYRQCALSFGLSKSQCDSACDINKSHNIGTWERNHGCSNSGGSSCERSFNNCKSSC